MRIRQGTTKPDLVLTLADTSQPGGLPLDEAVKVEVVGLRAGVEVFRRPAESVTATGEVLHVWQPDDTETVGDLTLQVDVEWTDGVQTFEITERVQVYGTGSIGPVVSVQQLIDHMSGITLDASQRADAAMVLAGVQRGLERALARNFVEVEVTERALVDEAGWAMVSRTPVRSVSEVDGQPVTGDARFGPNGVWVGYGYPAGWSTFGSVEVTYRGGGGLDPEDLADVTLAILDKAADIMTNRHDDARTPADLDTRAPEPKKTEHRWTNEEIDTWGMSRLRRKVIA